MKARRQFLSPPVRVSPRMPLMPAIRPVSSISNVEARSNQRAADRRREGSKIGHCLHPIAT